MILLKIGYIELLLKTSTGVQTVLNTLSKAVEVDYQEYKNPPVMTIKGRPVEISMRVLPDTGWKTHREGEDDEPGTDIIPVGLRAPAPARRANGQAALPRNGRTIVPVKKLFE